MWVMSLDFLVDREQLSEIFENPSAPPSSPAVLKERSWICAVKKNSQTPSFHHLKVERTWGGLMTTIGLVRRMTSTRDTCRDLSLQVCLSYSLLTHFKCDTL